MSRNIFGKTEAITQFKIGSFPTFGEFKENPGSFGVLNLIVVDASAEPRIPDLPSVAAGGEGSNFMLVILNAGRRQDERDTEISDITQAIGGMLDYDVSYFTRTGNKDKVFCLDQVSERARLKRALAGEAPATAVRKGPPLSSAFASAYTGDYSAGSTAAADAQASQVSNSRVVGSGSLDVSGFWGAAGAFHAGLNRDSSVILSFSEASEGQLSMYKTSLMTYLDAQTKRMPSGDAKRRVLEEAKARVRDSQAVDGVQAIVGEIRSIVSQHRNSVYRFFASIVSHPLSRRELDKVFNAENKLIRSAPRYQGEMTSSAYDDMDSDAVGGSARRA